MTKEELAEKICDEYCRFPYICTQEQMDEKCENCVLNHLFEGEKNGDPGETQQSGFVGERTSKEAGECRCIAAAEQS